MQFVLEQPASPNHLTAATITPQHLLFNRNDLFLGGRLRPHLFCLPVLKVYERMYTEVKSVSNTDAVPLGLLLLARETSHGSRESGDEW